MKRLVVVDDGGRVIGVVSRGDLLQVYARTDAEIHDQLVHDVIEQVVLLDSARFTVSVRDGTVRLSGITGRKTDADLVERLARQVDGVVNVYGELTYRHDDTHAPHQRVRGTSRGSTDSSCPLWTEVPAKVGRQALPDRRASEDDRLMSARLGIPTANPSGPTARVIDLFAEGRPRERTTPYGSVWDVVSAHGLEAAVVIKQGEEIDPDWFSLEVVDLIVLLRGHLRVEFDGGALPPLTMNPGHLLVIEPGVRCRAYRWPRSSPRPAVFLAVYPQTTRPSHIPGRG